MAVQTTEDRTGTAEPDLGPTGEDSSPDDSPRIDPVGASLDSQGEAGSRGLDDIVILADRLALARTDLPGQRRSLGRLAPCCRRPNWTLTLRQYRHAACRR